MPLEKSFPVYKRIISVPIDIYTDTDTHVVDLQPVTALGRQLAALRNEGAVDPELGGRVGSKGGQREYKYRQRSEGACKEHVVNPRRGSVRMSVGYVRLGEGCSYGAYLCADATRHVARVSMRGREHVRDSVSGA